MSTLEPGTVVAGRYRLRERIGSGGMGSVWSADHLTLGHSVALKFLAVTVAASDDARGRFTREAMLAAQLGELSRHICRVFDHGVLDDGTPFLVMERLSGEALNTRLRRERRLALDEVVEIVAQLCRALQVAHDAGVVHRDLKPANVFLCEDQDGLTVKLLDFGVAKARLENDAAATTADGAVVGTPAYMSPEQFENSARVDSRSDLWSVTAMAYRMVVGCEPFQASGLSQLALRIAAAEPIAPTEEDATLPRAFDAFVAQGLAKRPENRFASARALSAALADALRGPAEAGPPTAREPERPAPETEREGLAANTFASAVREPTVPPRSKTPWVAVAAVAVFGLVAGAVALGVGRPSASGASSAKPNAQAATTTTPAATTAATAGHAPGSVASDPSAPLAPPSPPNVASPTPLAPPIAPSSSASTAPAKVAPAKPLASAPANASGATKEPDTWKDDSIQ